MSDESKKERRRRLWLWGEERQRFLSLGFLCFPLVSVRFHCLSLGSSLRQSRDDPFLVPFRRTLAPFLICPLRRVSLHDLTSVPPHGRRTPNPCSFGFWIASKMSFSPSVPLLIFSVPSPLFPFGFPDPCHRAPHTARSPPRRRCGRSAPFFVPVLRYSTVSSCDFLFVFLPVDKKVISPLSRF